MVTYSIYEINCCISLLATVAIYLETGNIRSEPETKINDAECNKLNIPDKVSTAVQGS